MTQGSKYSDDLRTAALADYANGMHANLVAIKHGVGESTIRGWAKKAGLLVTRCESPDVLTDGHWVQDGYVQRWVS